MSQHDEPMISTADTELHPRSAPDLVSRRPARAAGGVLLAQGVLLAGVGAYAGFQVGWAVEAFGQGLPAATADTITSATFFLVLAGAAAVAGVGCFFARRFAWVMAMIVESLVLLVNLILYFVQKPVHAYALMLSGVIAVLYLNSTYVRDAFLEARPPVGDGDEH